MGIYSSVSRQGAYEPFELQVARGQIQAHSVVTIAGYNSDVDTAWEMITPVGNLSYPAAALQMTVSSADADDTSAGTGARTVLITGLDANYALIEMPCYGLLIMFMDLYSQVILYLCF